LSWDWIHADDLMSRALIRHSILADLVILSLAGVALEKDEPRPLAAAVAAGARAAVLGMPQEMDRLNPTGPVLIAWNGSPEAAAAMKAALPFLKLAAGVHLLEVEEKQAPYPRDAAARYLSRHDIHADVAQRQPIDGNVSAVIEGFALELGAAMIVMGAYSHSRLRELLLGGVTRDLIPDSRVPLLLCH
jgi:nucleotide-binding universal stress UspA family protein